MKYLILVFITCAAMLFAGAEDWQRLTEAQKEAYVQGYIDGVCYLLTRIYEGNPLWYYAKVELKVLVEKYYMDERNEKEAVYLAIYKAIQKEQKEQEEQKVGNE